MKKYLLLLFISTSFSYGQTTLANKLKITGNLTSTTYTKVNVQEADGTVNTISSTVLVDAFYFASASAFPVTGITDKLYIARDNNILYRFNGTIYVPLSQTITGTANVIPKFGSGGLVESSITEVSGMVGIGVATASSRLEIRGDFGSSPSTGVFKITSDSVFESFSMGILSTGSFFPYAQGFTRQNGLAKTMVIQPFGGNLLVNKQTDDEINQLQVNGNITASPATLSNQVVVKSQLDLKANLAGTQTFTGIHNFPTATAGTNTTQVATTAFVTSADIGNVKLTGNQTLSGTKTFVNNTTSQSILINNNSTAVGFQIINASNGLGQAINNTNVGTGIQVANSSSGLGIFSNNTSTGNGIFSSNSSTGNGIISTTSTAGTGFNYVGQNNGTNTFTVDKFGVTTIVGGTALNNAVPRSQLLYTNQTVTANKTVTIAEFVNNNHLILRVDTTAGNVTITLPTFTALQGYKVTIRKIDSSANSISITGVGGVNIDGASTLVVSGQYGKSTVGADLVQYIIL